MIRILPAFMCTTLVACVQPMVVEPVVRVRVLIAGPDAAG